MNKEKDNKGLEMTERQILGMLVYYVFKVMIDKAIQETLDKIFGGEKENETN